jgi:thermostable 8-oxoguanine DNA glycosylase
MILPGHTSDHLDVRNITKLNRTKKELEEFLLLCLCVAGKTATIQEAKLRSFLNRLVVTVPAPKNNLDVTPFYRLRKLSEDQIRSLLEQVGMGQYTRITAAIKKAVSMRLDLSKCPLEKLEEIPGLGRKTSRFFILHSRPNARVAVLDTHVLKYLKQNGVPNVPSSTPGSLGEYLRLEEAFLEIYEKVKDEYPTVAEFDLYIWKEYSR